MAFFEEEWWKRTEWFKVFLIVCIIGLAGVCLVYNLVLKPDLDSVEKNFGVLVSTEQAVRLYNHNTQGWAGDGECYSVWQYSSMDDFVLNTELQRGAGFRQDVFDRVTTKGIELPEGYFLPRELDQEVYYYYQKTLDDEVIIIFAPEVKLGDGKYYDNLLFVAEWYM